MATLILRLALLAGVFWGAAVDASRAQNWPSKPVRVIVPISAGSAIDIVARAVSQRFATKFGQPFVVENRPGAGTTLGAAAVASSAPDGYTLLFASTALTTTPSTVANMSYNVARDLAAVAPITNTPLILVTPPGQYKSVSEMVAAAKTARGTMTYGSNGYGGASHFTSERFRLAAGFEAQPVNFRGTPEIITEVMTGRIGFYFSPLTAAQSLVADRRIDALATTSRKRSATLPTVPTTLEAGYTNSDFDFWVGLFAPANTPTEIIDKLHAEAAIIAEAPDFLQAMAAIGGEPLERMSSNEFSAYVRAELTRNAEIAKAAGLTPQ